MRKYRIHFGIANLVGPSQKEVVALQNRAKLFMAALTGSTWLATNADWAMLVGFAGLAVDTLIACLYFERVDVQAPASPAADPGTCTEGGCE